MVLAESEGRSSLVWNDSPFMFLYVSFASWFTCLYMFLHVSTISKSLHFSGSLPTRRQKRWLLPGIAKGGLKSLPIILRSCSSWTGPRLERESDIEIRDLGVLRSLYVRSTPAAVDNKMTQYHVEICRNKGKKCLFVPTYQAENRGV